MTALCDFSTASLRVLLNCQEYPEGQFAESIRFELRRRSLQLEGSLMTITHGDC